jgi:catechol 2,3-dioxygenase-like lactoylglutathione lyase family enzyme
VSAIHHVAVETPRGRVDACVAFWGLLGFAPVEPAGPLGEIAAWVQRDGQQIHLLFSDEPTVPAQAHVAVVCSDYDEAIARLRDAGFDPVPGREHWGSPRCAVRDPAGHRVEVMQFPPA